MKGAIVEGAAKDAHPMAKGRDCADMAITSSFSEGGIGFERGGSHCHRGDRRCWRARQVALRHR